MSEEPDALTELAPILAGLEEAFGHLMEVAGQVTAEEFAWQPPNSEEWGIKRTLEHIANANNFAFAPLVAQARGLPSGHCIPRADFGSLSEAIMTIRVSHRRVVNQLAGITVEEFARPVSHPPLEQTPVREALRLMAEHYQEHAQQIEALREQYRAAAS